MSTKAQFTSQDEADVSQMRDGKYLTGSRDRKIVRTSVISILTNMLLAAFKGIVGLAAGSISIILDAVNNLSDALSGIITIIGTKLAAKPADKEHPYGYGRVEYLSATIVAAIVLYAGFSSARESVIKILHPGKPSYSTLSLVIIAVAVAVKLALGTYVAKTGRSVGSKSLIASGADARNDAVLSASVLATALLMKFTGVSLEAWVGVIISLIILKSGYEMMKDTIDDILGSRISSELSRAVKATLMEHELVYGAYDLFLHSYGPDRIEGSVHVEVPDETTATDIDHMTFDLTKAVYLKNHVILTAIGVYTHNSSDPKAQRILGEVREVLHEYPDILQLHGFYLDEPEKIIKFDIIIDFASPDREGEYRRILSHIRTMYPDYKVYINLDRDVSD